MTIVLSLHSELIAEHSKLEITVLILYILFPRVNQNFCKGGLGVIEVIL